MIQDLSHHSEPITPLFGSRTGARAEGHRLTPKQLAGFREHGYVAGVRVASDAQVEMLRAQLERLLDPGHPGRELWYEYHSNESTSPGRTLFHALGAWRIETAFHDVLWNPALTVPASQLLGGAVRFWHDQLFCKPAGHGGVVAWHQDYSYWTRTEPMQHLTCWIALDDATTENGCVHYVPGSHRWPLLPVTGLLDDMDAIQGVLDAEQRRAFEPVPVPLRKGEASFHHPLLVHGSFANTSQRPRRGLAINVFLDGTRSATDEPLLTGVPAVPRGEPLGGRFFPLLDRGDAAAAAPAEADC
jgi:ectoine hydroxylase-related dioxygenase (phytanoyl-CoA dioxygenase family)